jgi:hypothetical protein
MRIPNSVLRILARTLGVPAIVSVGLILLFQLFASVALEPRTWDEILYMQAAFVGTQPDQVFLRLAHTLPLCLFMSAIPRPLDAAAIFWATSALIALVTPAIYLVRNCQRKTAIAFAVVLYLATIISFEPFWWTPGLVYPDYTQAAYVALLALLCLLATKPWWGTYAASGALLVLIVSTKETGIVFALLLLIPLKHTWFEEGSSAVVRSLGVAAASMLACLLSLAIGGALWMGMDWIRLADMVEAWRSLNLSRATYDNYTFIQFIFRPDNPAIGLALICATCYAVQTRDFETSILCFTATALLAVLSLANIISTATVSGRYLIPMLPIYGMIIIRIAISLQKTCRASTLISAILLAASVLLGLQILDVRRETVVLALLPATIFSLICFLILSPIIPRLSLVGVVGAYVVIAFAPNSWVLKPSTYTAMQTSANQRFADLRALAAYLPGETKPIKVTFSKSFYRTVQAERGVWPLGAMLNFYCNRTLYPSKYKQYNQAVSDVSPDVYVFTRIEEGLDRNWHLIATYGESALYASAPEKAEQNPVSHN